MGKSANKPSDALVDEAFDYYSRHGEVATVNASIDKTNWFLTVLFVDGKVDRARIKTTFGGYPVRFGVGRVFALSR